ncbi:MAG TPA: hypothetical protein VMH22_10775 [bacterium]|nr:hypothetical protein [bacterium]
MLGLIVRVLQSIATWVNGIIDSQTLMAIHSALTGTVFALLIAISVGMRREEESDKTRVLLRAGSVYPLALWAVLGFPTLMVQGNVPYKVLPPLALALFMVPSLYRLLLILLDGNRLRAERTALLKDILKRHMNVSEDRRLAMLNLQDSLDASGIELVYFRHAPKGTAYHNVYAPERGLVTKLDFGVLKELAGVIEEAANDAEFTFRAVESSPEPQKASGSTPGTSQGRRLAENRRRYLRAGYGDIVHEASPVISFDQDLVRDPRALAEVRRLARRAFKLDPRYENLTSELRPALERLRDQLAEAVRNSAQSRIDECVSTYVELGSAFTEYALDWEKDNLQRDGSDKSEPAMHETEWILHDIRRVVDEAILTRSPESIYKTGFLGVTIILSSGMFKTPSLFLSFLNEPLRALLDSASQRLDNETRRQVIDAIAGWIKQVMWALSGRVTAALDDTGTIPEALTRSIRSTLNVTQNLLRSACNYRHKDDIVDLLNAADGLHTHVADDSPYGEEELELELNYANPSVERNASLQRTKARLHALKNLRRDLRGRTEVMHLWMGGWLLERRQRERDETLWADLYGEIENRLPSQLSELADAYLRASRAEFPGTWDTLLWREPPHHVGRTESIDRVFCMKALRLTAEGQGGEAGLKPVAELAWAVSGEHGLLQMLDEMARAGAAGESLLGDRQRAAIPTLKQAFERVKKEFEDSELARITGAPIPASRVVALAAGVAEGFADGGWFRPLLKKLGKHEERLTETPSDKADTFFGFSELRDKQEFVDRTDSDARQRGKAVGEAVAGGEDAFLAKRLLDWCTEVSVGSVDALIAQFGTKRDLAKAVLLTTYTSMAEYVRDNPSYVPRYSDPQREPLVQRQIGWIRRGDVYVPVVPVHVESPSKDRGGETLAVIDAASIGLLMQYSPLPVGGDSSKIRGQWYVDVRSMNDLPAQVEEFLKNAPDWLSKNRDQPEQERHLKSLVWFQVLERFTFDKPDDFLGLRLVLSGAKENDTGTSGPTTLSESEDAGRAA